MRLFQRNPLQVLLVALALAGTAKGQETTGTIAGLVTDASGAVITNAEISVVNTGTNATYKTTTNSAGNYILRTLPVGEYKLTATVTGFKRFEANNVVTQVNEVTRVDVEMTVG